MTQQLVRFDWAMKRLLRSKANFGILEGFLSELLNKDLKILNILESESNKEDKSNKFNKVDVLVELETKEIVFIEVQVSTELDYFHRMLFGTSKIISEHLKEGEKYANIKKVYSVNILYFDLGHGKDYVYRGMTTFRGIHQNDQLDLNEKQKELYRKVYVNEVYPEYYLIKVNQFNDVARDSLDEWIYFLKNEKIKENFRAKGLREAKEKLDELKLTPPEKQEYKKYLESLRYQESVVDSSYNSGRIEGEKIGIQKGKKIGIQKGERIGIQKGKKIGIQKGKVEEKLEIAKKMRDCGISDKIIEKITELTIDEMTKL